MRSPTDHIFSGEPLAEYHQNAMPALAAIAAGMILGTIVLATSLNTNLTQGSGANTDKAIAVAMTAAALMGLSAIIAMRFVRAWGITVTVYQDGFIYRRRELIEVFRWDDIAFVRQHITRHNPGLYRFYRPNGEDAWLYSYTIERIDGTRRELVNLTLDGIEALGEQLQTEVARRLLPHYLAQLEGGETLQFDQLAIDLSGLHLGDETLPWDEVAHTSVTTTHYLGQVVAIKRRGQFKEWARIAGSAVPNLHALLALIEHMQLKN